MNSIITISKDNWSEAGYVAATSLASVALILIYTNKIGHTLTQLPLMTYLCCFKRLEAKNQSREEFFCLVLLFCFAESITC